MFALSNTIYIIQWSVSKVQCALNSLQLQSTVYSLLCEVYTIKSTALCTVYIKPGTAQTLNSTLKQPCMTGHLQWPAPAKTTNSEPRISGWACCGGLGLLWMVYLGPLSPKLNYLTHKEDKSSSCALVCPQHVFVVRLSLSLQQEYFDRSSKILLISS